MELIYSELSAPFMNTPYLALIAWIIRMLVLSIYPNTCRYNDVGITAPHASITELYGEIS